MKKYLFLLMLFLVNKMSFGGVFIGHRENNVPVLEITPSDIQSLFTENLTNYQEVQVTDVILSDEPGNPDYMPSLIIRITYKEIGAGTDVHSLAFQYCIRFDDQLGKYVKNDDIGGLDQKQKPRGSCKAVNCVGCMPNRDQNGRILSCSLCTPVPNGNGPNTAQYHCGVKETDWGGILTGLGTVIAAISNFFN